MYWNENKKKKNAKEFSRQFETEDVMIRDCCAANVMKMVQRH